MADQKKPRQVGLLKTKRHVVELAGIAFRELTLASLTRADEERLWRLYRGLQWLDTAFGDWKTKLDNMLEVYALNRDIEKLLSGLHTLVVPVNPKAAEEYEKDLVKIPWEEALTTVSGHMADVEDFDEDKMAALVELLMGKPVRLTTPNPRRSGKKKLRAR